MDLLRDAGEGEGLGQRRGRGDDEEHHARRRRRFPQGVAEESLAAAAVGGGQHEGVGDGDRGDFRRRCEAAHDAHHHAHGQEQGGQGEERGRTAGTPARLGAGDAALFAGPEEDERHDDERKERRGNESGQEQRGGGDRRDGAEDQQHDARRDGFAHDGRRRQDRHDLAARVFALLEHAAHGGADGRDVGDLGSGDAGEDVHGDDDHLQQAAAQVADQGVDELGQRQGQAGGVHDRAGEDEERDGQEHEPLGARRPCRSGWR